MEDIDQDDEISEAAFDSVTSTPSTVAVIVSSSNTKAGRRVANYMTCNLQGVI